MGHGDRRLTTADGRDPVKRLVRKFKLVSAVNKPSSGGTVPCSELGPKDRDVKRVQRDSDCGIVPLNKFVSRATDVSAESNPISLGMVPVKLLVVPGNLPEREFSRRSKRVRKLNEEMRDGIVTQPHGKQRRCKQAHRPLRTTSACRDCHWKRS